MTFLTTKTGVSSLNTIYLCLRLVNLVGIVEDEINKCSYEVTILHHKGMYVTLLKEVNRTKFSINFTESYLRALEFAQVEVLILSLNNREN